MSHFLGFVAVLMGFLSPFSSQALILGQERLSEPAFHRALEGRRIGVLAHQASRSADGTHLVDRLATMPGLRLVSIFAPEHGYRSLADEHVTDSLDPVTGVPVYSLYGPRRAPTPEMLGAIDVLVIDLQDVGLRYYTYPATVVYALRAAQAAGVKVLLLDRPNPLGGERVDGATLESALTDGGLTTIASLPTRHGLTLGELSLYLNDELRIGADLTVVPMKDWARGMDWNATGLPWIPPSPALVRADQVLSYAILGALESANLAVGRGIDNGHAFEIYGAPSITPAQQARLVQALNTARIPGMKFAAHEWTPDRATFAGRLCRGFRVELTRSIAEDTYGPLLRVLAVLRSVLGEATVTDRMASMVGSREVLRSLRESRPVAALEARAGEEARRFAAKRGAYLLY